MHLDGLTVAITGGTGSFGQHLTGYLLANTGVRAIRIYSRDELKQHEMRMRYPDPRLRFLIGDVRDIDRLRRAFGGVNVVFHAAALKQVPACEYNPFEAVKTNIIGAQNVIEAAIDARVERVMALSTDKAVNPINLYGATKLCAEKLFVQGNSYVGEGPTRISCTRYGNVAGSRGSVIPVFLAQRLDGVIRITDKRMTRFWITLDQAVELVLRCTELMHGGEVFVPKLPSLKIVDLAAALAPEAVIDEVGIRPGEKLHEVLLTTEEVRRTVEYEDAYVIQPEFPWWNPGRLSGAQPLPLDFVYASDRNGSSLNPAEIAMSVGTLVNEPAHEVGALSHSPAAQ